MAALAIRRDRVDQESVELQDIERPTHRHRQSRMTLCEIIEHDPNSHAPELFEGSVNRGVLVQQETPRDLEVELLRR